MDSFMELLRDEITILKDADSPQVQEYKNNRFYRETLASFEHDLKVLKRTEKTYQDDSPEYIKKKLPNSYKVHS